MITIEDVHREAEGRTVVELLRRNAIEYADLPALTSGCADDAVTLTWSRLRDEVAAVTHGLAEAGLGPGDRMLIMSSRRIEHWVVDLAAEHVGAVPCTIYDTLSTNQIRYVAQHSAATVVVLEGAEQLARWLPVLDDLPALRRIVVLEGADLPPGDDRFVDYRKLAGAGAARHAVDQSVFERLTDAVTPDQPVCMIYTSGTTGDPKAVVVSHRNVVYQFVAVQLLHPLPMGHARVAYLPLAHIAERMTGIYTPIFLAAHVTICADPARLGAALAAARPHMVFGVPRVWEKLTAALQGALAGMDVTRRAAVDRAREVAAEVYRLRAAKAEVPEELADRYAALDAEVLAPIRAVIGLDNVLSAASGAAPIPVAVLDFLASFGIQILEVWGLSETSGCATVNELDDFRPGSVGKPLPGVDLRLGEDGEVFVRGPIVFLGYLQADGTVRPDVDEDGWLATGDVGTIDADGFLTITDRKKELIITSGGKNVAPTRVEGLLRAHPLVGQAVAVGDRRPYLTALLVLDEETAPAWAKARGLDTVDLAELAGHPVVLDELAGVVERANAALSRAEQIKRYRVLATPWTPESGELTPTLKLKRRVITDRYADVIEDLYRARAAG